MSESNQEQLIALARRTPLTRGAVADLAEKVPPHAAGAAAAAALDLAGVDAAMVLAFAAAARGAKLDPSVTRALLPEVLSLDHVGPLVFATDGKPADVIVSVLDDKLGDLELECLLTLLAAELLEEGAEPPPSLLTRARWLARHKLAATAQVHLGAAAIRLKDRNLGSLSSPHVNKARRAKKTIDDTLETARLPPLEVLPDTGGARVSSGFTVRHESPAVGRNDPCPCGSGKKYKKCHALVAEPLSAPSVEVVPPAASLGAEQVALLRPRALAALETAKLSPKAFVEAFRRAVDYGRFDLTLRMIEEARSRSDLAKELRADEPEVVPILIMDALRAAEEIRAREDAEKLHALLPPDLAEREEFGLECLRAEPTLLASIEREAQEALRGDAEGALGMLFASALLRWYPALGIYVARGALHEGRTKDSQTLLERMEDARDRLLLSPFEPWWDVYDAFFEAGDERREQKKDDARKKKLAEDLRRARAASRKSNAEMEKLQRRVSELDDALSAAPRSAASAAAAANAPPAVPADLAEERRRLKNKIDELVRIIGEGQDERRDLRKQLAEREEEELPVSAEPKGKPKDDPDAEPEGMHDDTSVDGPRQVLVPRYSDRASKAVTDLSADAADGVLGVVAALAAGKPNAWGGVKQLTKVRGVLSARAGIHHRVLFATNERALDVLEVLHRKDLEQVVARLARVLPSST